MTEKKVKLTAGCWDCYGASMRWIGMNAHTAAADHAKATGHGIWTAGMSLPAKKAPPQAKSKSPERPIATKNEPLLPKARLSKRNMCEGKIKHASAATAQKELDHVRGDKSAYNVYRCLWCSGWHIGHYFKEQRK